MTGKASCPLPCSAHLTVVCSLHCDGLTNHNGDDAGVALGSSSRGADGADAASDFWGTGCSPNDSAVGKQPGGSQLQS